MKKLTHPYDNRPTSIADIAAEHISTRKRKCLRYPNDELFKLNCASWWYPHGETLKKWIRTRSTVHLNLHKIRCYNCKREIFRAYTLTSSLVTLTVTGLPDATRGRIIGVYARLALYGAGYLMAESKRLELYYWNRWEESIRLRRRSKQPNTKHFKKLLNWVTFMGVDDRRPAFDTKKRSMDKHRLHGCLPCDQRCCCFSWTCANRLDIYAERDLARGTYTESRNQEFVDDFVTCY